MLQQIQITAPCPVSSETGFFLQPAGGDEVLDGALDGGFGQTCVAGNGWDGRKTGTALVAPLAEIEVYCHRAGREVLLVECIEEAHVTPPAPVGYCRIVRAIKKAACKINRIAALARILVVP